MIKIFQILILPEKRNCNYLPAQMMKLRPPINTVPGTTGRKWVPLHLTACHPTEHLHAKQEQGQLMGTEGLAADSS